MKIAVTVKQVADPNIPPRHIELDSSRKRIVSPKGIPPVINGYDANAVEQALQLREKHGGSVTVFGVGDDSARESLRRAIAMGADSAVLLNDPDWLNADSAGVGAVLAAAMRKKGPFDIVLCGRQASDTDGGQVLHWIAKYLDLPIVSPVVKLEASDATTLIVQRVIEDGYQRVQVELPALLGISSEINEPRFPPMRGTMAAAKAMIPGLKAGDIELSAEVAKVELRTLEIQLRTGQAELLEGDTAAARGASLADKLHELGFL